MKLRPKYLTFVFLVNTILMIGQDIHVTQFHAIPIYLNPAFTGSGACARTAMLYRNQWPSIKKAYQSYLLTFDHFLQREKVGIGFLAAYDEAGTGDLKTTVFNASFAYELRINRFGGFRFGVQPGFINKRIVFNQLLFGDQLTRGGGMDGALKLLSVENPTISKTFLDVGVGGLFFYKSFWLGSSFQHVNKPNESLLGNEDAILPVKYSVHGGIIVKGGKENVKDDDLSRKLYLVFNYRGQNEFDQFDIGTYYNINILTFGLWYRGIPGLKAYKPGYQNNDAVAIILGLHKDLFKFGYSYDITISRLAANSGGAHEITLSYMFCRPKTKKTRRPLILCPKF